MNNWADILKQYNLKETKEYTLYGKGYIIPNAEEGFNNQPFHLIRRIFWYYLSKSKGAIEKIHILTTKYNSKTYFIGAIVFSNPLGGKRTIFFPAMKHLALQNPLEYKKAAHTTIDYSNGKINNIHLTSESNKHQSIIGPFDINKPLFTFELSENNLELAYNINAIGKFLTPNGVESFEQSTKEELIEVIDMKLPLLSRNVKIEKFYFDLYIKDFTHDEKYLVNYRLADIKEDLFGTFQLRDNIFCRFYSVNQHYDSIDRIVYQNDQTEEWIKRNFS